MLQLPLHRFLLALGENAAKHVGLTDLIKRLIRRGDCGGVRWTEQPLQNNIGHVRSIAELVTRYIDVRARTGLEIGPGDNLGAAFCLLVAGAQRVYAVEKFASIHSAWCERLYRAIDPAMRRRPEHIQSLFEDFTPPECIDFIYSHDVIEHVDPPSIFRHAFKILKSGGDFVNMIDLTGHGVFYDLQRPLDFLTCPDRLYSLLFSAMETSNRVRWSQLLELARTSGFQVMYAAPIRRANPAYLAQIRPHLLPRYRALADDDLSVMQCILHLRKP